MCFLLMGDSFVLPNSKAALRRSNLQDCMGARPRADQQSSVGCKSFKGRKAFGESELALTQCWRTFGGKSRGCNTVPV